MTNFLKKFFALVMSGMSTFVLIPNTNYSQFVSNPNQITQKSWQRTGEILKSVIDRNVNNERRKHE